MERKGERERHWARETKVRKRQRDKQPESETKTAIERENN